MQFIQRKYIDTNEKKENNFEGIMLSIYDCSSRNMSQICSIENGNIFLCHTN